MRVIKKQTNSYQEGNIKVTKEEINKMIRGDIPYDHEQFLLYQKGMAITNKRFLSEGDTISRRFPKNPNNI